MSDRMTNSKKSGELTFADFRTLAKNRALSGNEKIDFPESYRRGYTKKILSDIAKKLHLVGPSHKVICDIGCGCGDLAHGLCRWTRDRRHTLVLVDSKEMLAHLPDWSNIKKSPGKFPNTKLVRQYRGRVDAVLCYSVLQYVYGQQDVFTFIEQALELLTGGGILLIGDIPNEDKRDRFLKTPEGAAFRTTLGRDRTGKIGDSLIFAVMVRFRRLGFETYLVPQPATLPLHNRREDVLIVKRV